MKSLSIQNIAKKLRAARLNKGITQTELARLLDVPQSYVAKIESGGTDLRTTTLLEVTRLLDLEIVFVPMKQLSQVEWALTGETERSSRQLFRAAYEPDEDEDDEESES